MPPKRDSSLKIPLTELSADARAFFMSAPTAVTTAILENAYAMCKSCANLMARPQETSIGSQAQGVFGETYVGDILAARYTSAVINTARTSKSGDLSVQIGGAKIIVEVKNYTNTVPSAECDKFRRDLAAGNACGGVFVSLQTPIANMDGSFTVRHEIVGVRKIPCVYVVSSSADIIVTAVDIVAGIHSHFRDMEEARQVASDQVCAAAKKLYTELDCITKSKQDIQDTAAQSHAALNKICTQMSINDAHMRDTIKTFADTAPDIICADFVKDAVQNYIVKYPQEIRDCILRVATTIETFHVSCMTIPWKLSAKKLSHASGISIDLLTVPAINIPRKFVSDDMIFVCVKQLCGKKISLCSFVTIEIDTVAEKLIRDALLPGITSQDKVGTCVDTALCGRDS